MRDSRSTIIDPWGSTAIESYEKLFEEFGIQKIDTLVEKLPHKPSFIRRGIIFGHRDFERVVEAINGKQAFAVMSGIKPTGPLHVGTILTLREIIYFQQLGGVAFYCIADIEAYEDNGIPFEESERTSLDNLLDALALGLDPSRAYIYRQSKENDVKDLAFIFARSVTLSTIEAIYGARHMGLYLSALIQAGDILLPQLTRFGGPKPTVVPVGIDQDPHIRLCRDLAYKFREKYGFIPPSATYHMLIKGLDGSPKMSKRNPMSYFTLTEDIESIAYKLRNAFTGGRPTAKEQKVLGGEPEKCPIFDLYKFFFVEDDQKLLEVYYKCRNGEILCGEDKAFAVEVVTSFIKEHQRKRTSFIDKAREILGLL
ncbi:MAG: tryptophan--tRNA ligase [Candidatus Nezhaarchaeota archaeon]|nr:tryptophan--tRNA ligase [Candidatus Nezhaarchaeota archaeon]MCX8142050.1 tryptophan--tRNA ligase [Candidatus Nezhaarchaeota archaeon]MDW8050169.1 tryptophan--tRNA ligase [Nitrososphaerota archaeon]